MSHPEVPENAFVCELQVRWSDQDVNEHVNNSRILTLTEEARVQATKAWTGAVPDARVVRALNVSFEHPIHYGPQLFAHVWISRIGTSSFTFSHTLSQNGVRCAHIEATVVTIDPDTKQSTPLSAHLRSALLPQLEESVTTSEN
jgi:acyl-CoA thioester hydrolase